MEPDLTAALKTAGIAPLRVLARRPFADCLKGTLIHQPQDVFIKVLRSDIPNIRRNFLREIDVLTALDGHEGVPVLIAASKAPPAFHACHFVNAPLLTRFIADGEPLDYDAIGHHVATLARWIRSFHARGYVHRDLSPEHVLLTTTQTYTLVDYGLTKAIEDCSNPMLARARDCQAMGLIAWELICGKPVFRFNDPTNLYIQIEQELMLMRSLLPADPLAQLIARCLDLSTELTPAHQNGRAPAMRELDDVLDAAVAGS